jgi:hypothetical protein
MAGQLVRTRVQFAVSYGLAAKHDRRVIWQHLGLRFKNLMESFEDLMKDGTGMLFRNDTAH